MPHTLATVDARIAARQCAWCRHIGDGEGDVAQLERLLMNEVAGA
jgi:hypothetical protein